MLRKLQRHFGFHKKELKGISVLLLLIVIVWLLPLIYDFYEESDTATVALIAADTPPDEIFVSQKPLQQPVPQVSVHYFKFDPNNLPADQWRRLGLNEKQIKNIKNFEAKGGRFTKKEDLLKMYTLSSADYKLLEPYIDIQLSEKVPAVKDAIPSPRGRDGPVASKRAVLSILDLNEADSLSLLSLPGIGPVFASRIVRYRELLGGFYDLSQLQEVYGMDAERYQQIQSYLKLDHPNLRRIAINRSSYEELRKHPYINAKYAKLILAYKKQHGAYKSLEDLSGISLFDEKYLRKIAPYLIFDL